MKRKIKVYGIMMITQCNTHIFDDDDDNDGKTLCNMKMKKKTTNENNLEWIYNKKNKWKINFVISFIVSHRTRYDDGIAENKPSWASKWINEWNGMVGGRKMWAMTRKPF
jgi:hypothetical protein